MAQKTDPCEEIPFGEIMSLKFKNFVAAIFQFILKLFAPECPAFQV